jgi:crotonobetainyl-CoA:carnitine CoA-transferase CaiB-like acyl-CoA transferase
MPAAALARTEDLVQSEHLRARGFWDTYGRGVLPGLPWSASFARLIGQAPELGADTDAVLRTVLDLSPDAVQDLRKAGVLG